MVDITVLTLFVTEILSDSQASKSDTGTGSWRLIHLTEDESDLRLALQVDDFGLLHFMVQVVALTSTLAYPSKDGVTTVGLGNVVLEGSASVAEALAKY